MAVGDTINANDPFAALRTSMNTILNGTGVHGGYNQNLSIAANPATGDLIDDAYYDSLYAAAAKIANYYNITNPFTAVNEGDTIKWADYANVAAQFKTDIETRFNSPWSYSSGWDFGYVAGGSSEVSNWNGTKSMNVSFAFSTADHMNAWFSAGGEIRVSFNHVSSTTAVQDLDWDTLCSDMGTYVISVRPTDSTTLDVSTRKKYSDLGSSITYLSRKYSSDADYSANYADVGAYISGATVYVQARVVDAHVARSGSGSGYDGPWSWTGSDNVNGTTTGLIAGYGPTGGGTSVSVNAPTATKNSDF